MKSSCNIKFLLFLYTTKYENVIKRIYGRDGVFFRLSSKSHIFTTTIRFGIVGCSFIKFFVMLVRISLICILSRILAKFNRHS